MNADERREAGRRREDRRVDLAPPNPPKGKDRRSDDRRKVERRT